MNKIIKDRNKLKIILEKEKKKGKTIVFANGCFDLFHVGHLRYLEGAKEQGDILVVAINDDNSIKKQGKKGRPIIPLKERMEILESLEAVDYIIPFSEQRVDNLLSYFMPHIHAKGTDYREETVPERETVLSYGGKIKIVGDPKQHSTTDLIKRIKNTFFNF
ncbi:MAG: D-glycero-beta-D-manno-heptose 1-phosphate adenylyltransferase [Deltaproteobacteria bacterium]|nr:MAG: D-glycero-beta-D-manno-heptose 1-phosphate adenylyltransferase [Deltaproteobacteria bacterium]